MTMSLCIQSPLYFFFLSYGDLRVLHFLPHAFPTRRSSDLIPATGDAMIMETALPSDAAPDCAPADPSTLRRAIAASALGNATEWFDYCIYAYGVDRKSVV